MVIIEGMDNSGKSTLARQVSSIFPMYMVQVSEGPPKFPGEMDERVKKYLGYSEHVIYDRHPCVSQPIYGQMRSHHDPISPDLITDFYYRKPLLIYCDPGARGMAGHQERAEVDSPVHVAAINENYHRLLQHYREWAIDHAVIVYRIGDPIARVLRMIEALA